MSDVTNPAGTTGGNNTTPTNAILDEIPSRVRVHALAKLLGASSREVVRALTELEEPVRGVQSSVTRETALRVAQRLAEAPTSGIELDTGVGDPVIEPEADWVDEDQPVAKAAQLAPIFAPAVFMPPDASSPVIPAKPAWSATETESEPDEETSDEETAKADVGAESEQGEGDGGSRRRRRRGRRGRGRGKGGAQGEDETETPAGAEGTAERADAGEAEAEDADADAESAEQATTPEGGASRRRRRRRRRRGTAEDDATPGEDDPPNTVVHVRESREEPKPEPASRDEVRSVRGSTRLEAKRQRRRDGRDAGRRRAPILSEAEFLARREAVDRKMVVRQQGDRIQMGVLEDGVLVEHFVTSSGTGSLAGNVYLGRVQNVLPSMEAAFVDIGRGRNAVLYAGEVDWDAAGLEGKARKIEQALSTGDSVLVQVTKDPVGHKGARLTTQISLPGRFLVYLPGGGATGISRKLPENERRRLKDILKRIVPEDAGVIIRTASEGISEEELARDVRRLQAQWEVIKEKAEGTNGAKKASSPSLLYEEPDLLIKVVRDLFTEDFSGLVVQGDDAWDTIDAYVRHVAPDLLDRLRRHVGTVDVFTEYRIDEQLLKALDRKVWLPSGGYLIIDRTEAMTVIDVNTGKFTGSGGNLEETVTRNNLESAEEIVRQLRLRDIGGIIVIDFIDMVLESNRDLVLRRLTECLGRDRTRHQVAEVTSLGLVQMTRKRVGTGLLEAYSASCEHCRGRGVIVSADLAKKASGGPSGQPGAPERAGKGGDREGRDRGHGRDEQRQDRAQRQQQALAQRSASVESVEAVEPVEPEKVPTEVTPEPPAEETVAAVPAEESAEESAATVASTPEPEARPADVTAAEQPPHQPAVEPAEPVTTEQPVAAEQPVPVASAGLAPAEDTASVVAPVVAAEAGAQPVPAAEPTPPAEQADVVRQPEAAPRRSFTSALNGHQPAEEQVHSATNGRSAGDGADQPVDHDAEQATDGVPMRRRPRRAASRPAGPPVASNSADQTSTESDPGLETVRRLT
jgi:ribonuclease E